MLIFMLNDPTGLQQAKVPELLQVIDLSDQLVRLLAGNRRLQRGNRDQMLAIDIRHGAVSNDPYGIDGPPDQDGLNVGRHRVLDPSRSALDEATR